MTCTQWDVRWPNNATPTETDPELLTLALAAAQDVLWALTGRRYGLCQTTERYRIPPGSFCGVSPYKSIFDGQWRNMRGGMNCCAIPLDQRPVRKLLDVRLYGVSLNPVEYYVSRNSLMRRGACWPAIDETLEPVIEVDYAFGVTPPPLASLAIGELANEFLRGFNGDVGCRLPSNAVTITRQGVTVQLADPAALYKEWRTGLPLCDAFIRSVNPNKLQTRSRVYSPDVARRA